MNNKLRVEFGEPKHGWLQVDIYSGELRLSFEASDVPFNPIDQLISTIRQVVKGIEATSSWHMEPTYYRLIFSKTGDTYKMLVQYADNDKGSGQQIFETTGDFNSIILPFYRAVKKFFSKTFNDLDWPRTEIEEIEKLADLVRTMKLRFTE